MRVAGPFTVESLSPHRVVPADEEELIELIDAAEGKRRAAEAHDAPTISRRWCWSTSAPPACSRAHKDDTHHLHFA